MKALTYYLFAFLLTMQPLLFSKSKFPNQKKSFVIGAEFQYFFAKANGKGKYKANSIDGTDFSYSKLGLKKSKKDLMLFGVYFGSQMHRLHFEFSQYTLKGTGSISSPLTADTKTFPAGSKLNTDMDGTWGRAYYELWDQRNNVSYAILLGAELYKFDYSIYNQSDQSNKSFDMQSINPLLGTNIILGQGRYCVTLKAFYMPAFLKIVDYDTLDVKAAFQFKFGNYMNVEAGYRYIDSEIQARDGDQFNGMKFKGVFIGLELRY